MKLYNNLLIMLGVSLLGLSSITQAAITDSKHDLSLSSTATTRTLTTGTEETCVFCHTPHKAASDTVPLWNKQLTTAPSGANLYASTTMDGTANFTNSTSMACLSCHDGTQAMDNIVNATSTATADNYDSTGGGAVGLTTYGWTGNATSTGVMNGAVTMLGTNLGDDHPVAIPYGGGGVTVAAGTDAPTDPDFRSVGDTVDLFSPTVTYTLKRALIGTQNVLWFDSGTNANRIDSDEIRLYTVDGKTNPQVECASCHDPHKGENVTFLRIANTQSAVCVTCHVK